LAAAEMFFFLLTTQMKTGSVHEGWHARQGSRLPNSLLTAGVSSPPSKSDAKGFIIVGMPAAHSVLRRQSKGGRVLIDLCYTW